MSKPKVLITNPEVPEIALNLLREKCELIINEEQPYPSKAEIVAKCKGVDAIFWVSKYSFDEEILQAAGAQMQVASTMSAGLDNVDLVALKRHGVKLGHTPVVLNEAVSDVAILLILATSRRIIEGRLAIENNSWRYGPQWQLGRDISGSTVGIVGLGNIGQTIVKKLKPFGVSTFLYSGHKESNAGKELGCEFVTFDELLVKSDFVVCSCPLTDETRGMFNEAAFNKMKSTGIFINIARGGIVVQEDLVKVLENKRIFGAGLDVMTPEPLPRDDPLLKLSNCVLLPHIGSATVNTRNSMAELAAQNILMGLGGQKMFTPAY
ncbi:glyoxylate reductase/hydroxypyruvate reductase-like [Onthophagus taurus]|uniref:glyoxylate reductase/hydroxypyruvate reductase-like n=1 Tax=Onthophagus taurus TaxID=166361 RepID=UPI0039BDDCF8